MAPAEPGRSGGDEPERPAGGEADPPSQAGAPPSTDMGAERAGDPPRPGDEAPAEKPAVGEDVCPDCGGSGVLNGEECPTCRGTGVVGEGVGGG